MAQAPLHPCPCSPTCPVLLPKGVKRCKAGAVKQEHTRSNLEVRKWYRQKRWEVLRNQVLREETLCRSCEAEGKVELTTDVDHIKRHKGSESAFFNRANLQGLCKSHHSAKTARGE